MEKPFRGILKDKKMKKTILLLLWVWLTLTLQAQVSKSINVTAGGLSSALTDVEKSTITNLTLTGTIDARDFKTMRDDMLILDKIDLSGTAIVDYNGTAGTTGTSFQTYLANTLPMDAFFYNNIAKTSLTSISLPLSVTSIGASAFNGCSGLNMIPIPSSVTSIAQNAFDNCPGLFAVDAANPNYSSLDGVLFNKSQTELIKCPTSKTGNYSIPSTVMTIDNNVFGSCYYLTSITIPSSVTTINNGSFFSFHGFFLVDVANPNYSSLDGVLFNKSQTELILCPKSKSGSYSIPATVMTIDNNAFVGCYYLTSINIPSSVTSIASWAFNYCSGAFAVDAANPNYSSFDGVLFNKSQTELIDCPYSKSGSYSVPSTVVTIKSSAFERNECLTSVTIPSSVKIIESGAFQNSRVISLTIASSVTSIGSYAFQGCSKLVSITVGWSVPLSLTSSGVFSNENKTACILYVPYGTKTLYAAANQWKDFSNIVEMPGFKLSATTVTLTAEENSSATITVSSNATWMANSDQSWLVPSLSMNTGDGTLTLTATANPNATNRTATVIISATGVGSQTITVTQKATNIKTKALDIMAGGLFSVLSDDEKSTVSNLTLTGTVDARDFKTMRDDMPLLEVIDLSGATIVSYTGTEGTISNSVTYPANTIPISAFYKAPLPKLTLKSFSFPTNTTAIGVLAFCQCPQLTALTFPQSLTTIQYHAFSSNKALTTISIPSSVTTIDNAFSSSPCLFTVDASNPNYSSLNGVLLNKAQTELIQCPTSKAGTYSIPSSVTTIKAYAFTGCEALTSLSVPSSVITIESLAFQTCSGLFVVDAANLNYSSLEGVLLNKAQTTLIRCPDSKTGSYSIPASITSIESGAFSGCSGLTSLVIPSTVTTIGSYAFSSCINLTSIIVNNLVPLDLGLSTSSNIFSFVNKTSCILKVPYGTKTLYAAASQWEDFLNIIEMPGFKLSSTTLDLSDKATSVSINLSSNIDWLISSDQAWLTVSPSSGSGKNSIMLTTEANISSATRTATVTVSAAGVYSQIIKVTQAENTIVNQNILLCAGWNIISSYLVPSNKDMKSVFQLLIDAGKLKKVMDEAGKTIENFGAFGGWKNNIGNLNSAKGYKVNVTSASTLLLDGIPVQLPSDIALASGWNIISFPSAYAQDAKAIIQSLIDAGKLKKVMDEAGKTIENFGAFGGWKNNIGNFIPGKGYKVNVTGSCTLTIPVGAIKAATFVPEVLVSTHFAKSYTGNGIDHMNIHLVNLQASGIKVGDEIGIYDGSLCVGSATIGAEQLMDGSISIPASSNDGLGQTMNGFTCGNPVNLQLFRAGQTYQLNIEKFSGINSFDKNQSLFAQVNIDELDGILNSNNSDQIKCFPNPFAQEINIEVQYAKPTEIVIEIYNITGQQIKTLFKGTTNGNLLLKWNGTSESGEKVASGVYLCKVNGQSKQLVFK
jgi:hypothetical protein